MKTDSIACYRIVNTKIKPFILFFSSVTIKLYQLKLLLKYRPYFLFFIYRSINILSFTDKTCLVWGKTCSGTGNCWLYNGEALRYLLNFTAASEYLIEIDPEI